MMSAHFPKSRADETPAADELVPAAPDSSHASPRAVLQRRRRQKFAWFLVCETIAISLTIVSVLAAFSLRFASESWTPVFRFVPLIGAVVATVLPILFYGRGGRRK